MPETNEGANEVIKRERREGREKYGNFSDKLAEKLDKLNDSDEVEVANIMDLFETKPKIDKIKTEAAIDKSKNDVLDKIGKKVEYNEFRRNTILVKLNKKV